MEIKIVDSFVTPRLRKPTTSNSIYKKLHIGSSSQVTTFDDFFNNFTNISCEFDQQNLLEYIDNILTFLSSDIKVRMAYNALESHYESKRAEIFARTNFNFTLAKYTDNRYYIYALEADANGVLVWDNFFRYIFLTF